MTFPRRLRALVLLLLFLGGGTSLPSLHVLLFHLRDKASHTAEHVEAADGGASHVGHCGISCPASEGGALGVQVVTALLDGATPPITLRRSRARVLMPRTCGIGFRSRPPPVFSV